MWRKLNFLEYKSAFQYFFYLFSTFLMISCSDSGGNSESDDIDKITMMEDLREEVESELCSSNSLYLQCLQISEKQCYLDVQKMRSKCWQISSTSIPELIEPEILSSIARDYSECLIQEHLNIGNFDKDVARKCLDNN